MKILQVHNRYIGFGGEDAVLSMEYELLTENGHTVKQFFFDNNELKQNILKIIVGLVAIFNIKSYYKLKKAVDEFKPDIIHVHNFFPIASPSIFYVKKNKKIPIVLTLHNYRLICANAELYRNSKPCYSCVSKHIPIHGMLHKCYRNSYTQSLIVTIIRVIHSILGTWEKKIDGYILLSNFSKKLFDSSTIRINPSKIYVKPNFVFNSSFQTSSRESHYLFVGRMSDAKGVEVVVRSAMKNGFKLSLIGTGPKLEELRNITKNNSNILFFGERPRDFISQEMKKCRALIFPSIKTECFPVTILESFSTATPVISSNIPPLTEIITNEYDGVFFDPLIKDDLYNKIQWFEKKTESSYDMYRNARTTFEKKYTSRINYEQLIEFYNLMINKKL